MTEMQIKCWQGMVLCLKKALPIIEKLDDEQYERTKKPGSPLADLRYGIDGMLFFEELVRERNPLVVDAITNQQAES